MSQALLDKESVLAQMASHPAVAALTAGSRPLLVEAKWQFEELTVYVAREDVVAACLAVQAAGYNFMEDLTAVDWLPRTPRFQVSIHVLSHSLKERIRIAVLLDEQDPSMDSVTAVWPSANYFEREVFDLMGIRFNGHPNLRRIMLPEEWEGHPLRKDYPVEGYR